MDGVMGALQRGLSFPFMVFRGCDRVCCDGICSFSRRPKGGWEGGLDRLC